MSRISLVIFALAVVGLMAFGASQASASHVRCGEVITEDTTLHSDLDCGDLSGASSALTIGADGVTLDLGGHMVESVCDVDCAGTHGIDNSGGYDRVQILNGTIRLHATARGFAHSIALIGADKNSLAGLTVEFGGPMARPGVGISLSGSNDN